MEDFINYRVPKASAGLHAKNAIGVKFHYTDVKFLLIFTPFVRDSTQI